MTKAGLARAASIVAFLTVVSKVLGFIREASLAAVFGATAATDAYLVAQTIPYLLFATISYALATTFIPLYSHVREERGRDAAFRFANTVIWAVLGVAIIFVIAGEALAEQLVRVVAPGFSGPVAELTAYLSRIIFPMMIFQLMSGILTGILQADNQFAVPTAAGLLQNIAIITSILVFGPRYGIASVAVGTLVGAGLSMAVKIPAVGRIGFRWRRTFDLWDPTLKRMAILMLPAILGAGAGQLNTLFDRILASGLPEGRVAALSYANKLMQLAPGILGASVVTVVYPTLAKLAARREWKSFADSLIDALSSIYFMLVPIAVGVVVLRVPLVRIVFERGVFDDAATQETAWALLFLGLGIGIFTMRELVTKAFFTTQDTTTPMILGLVTVGLNVVFNLLLVGPLEQGGLALGTVLASTVGLILALFALRRKSPVGLPVRRFMRSIGLSASAAGVMGVVVWLLYPAIESLINPEGTLFELVQVSIAVSIGAIVYVGVAWLLRVPELFIAISFLRQGFYRLANRARGQQSS